MFNDVRPFQNEPVRMTFGLLELTQGNRRNTLKAGPGTWSVGFTIRIPHGTKINRTKMAGDWGQDAPSVRQIQTLVLATNSLCSAVLLQGLRKEGRRGTFQRLADVMIACDLVQAWIFFAAEMITGYNGFIVFVCNSFIYVVAESIHAYLAWLYTKAIVGNQWLGKMATLAAVCAVASTVINISGVSWLVYTSRTWKGAGFTIGGKMASTATILRWVFLGIVDVLPLFTLLDPRVKAVEGSIRGDLGTRALKITLVMTSLSIIAIVFSNIPDNSFSTGLFGTQVPGTASRLFAAILYNTVLRKVQVTTTASNEQPATSISNKRVAIRGTAVTMAGARRNVLEEV
ncbi:hypothetical protein BC832DRAFT_542807 [Gaertneriomyces semiglobifer]|nr:hypothetical protein BC832DRAFT_542807 [Gaertneriomyces semiglobifer]